MRDTIRKDTGKRHAHKYTNQNPIHRLALKKYVDTLAKTLRPLNVGSVLDFGCGEGFLLERLEGAGIRFPSYHGVDVRPEAIETAKVRHPHQSFSTGDILCLPQQPGSFDLVLACQVLEHVPDPARLLQRLTEISSRYVLLTVPLEPWFQIMNLLRGRDLANLGNHPEHINHWGVRSFRAFVSKALRAHSISVSFPFIVLLGEK